MSTEPRLHEKYEFYIFGVTEPFFELVLCVQLWPKFQVRILFIFDNISVTGQVHIKTVIYNTYKEMEQNEECIRASGKQFFSLLMVHPNVASWRNMFIVTAIQIYVILLSYKDSMSMLYYTKRLLLYVFVNLYTMSCISSSEKSYSCLYFEKNIDTWHTNRK